MPIRHIDHILIAMPAGREDEARAFYHGILGLTAAGLRVTEDEPIEGCDRRHVDDPFGNRIELIEPHAR
ncbi:MAG: hypothetical protein WBW99_20525 [Pseudolabrys sp.]